MSYIGNSPGVASQRVETTFTATASQTVFTPSSGYTLGYCDVYQNGAKLVNGDDYSAPDGVSITLTTGAAAGDSIVIVASFPRGLSDGYLKAEADAKYLTIANPSYTGTLTGGTGLINIGSGQLVKDTSGNVGVGVTPSAWGSPFTALDMGNSSFAQYNGATTIVGYNSYADKYKATGLSAGKYQISGATHSWSIAGSGTAGNPITFTQAMTLDASGNLLLGTTTAPNATFISKSNFIGLQTSNPADSTKWRQIVFANNSADATLYFPNGTNTATLSSAGAWTNASDARQKTNIVDIKYGLDTVLNVQPHSYNRTDVEGEFIGFVAQELKKIIPEVVFGSDETSYSVDYGSLVAVAFKAIQEQQAIITQLQADVATLKGTA